MCGGECAAYLNLRLSHLAENGGLGDGLWSNRQLPCGIKLAYRRTSVPEHPPPPQHPPVAAAHEVEVDMHVFFAVLAYRLILAHTS